jgi:hypothetical protein
MNEEKMNKGRGKWYNQRKGADYDGRDTEIFDNGGRQSARTQGAAQDERYHSAGIFCDIEQRE